MKFLKNITSAAAVSGLIMFSGVSNSATALGVTTVTITSAVFDFLQISEVQAFDASNSAISFASATASNATSGFGTAAALAIDGVVNQVYPAFYHSSTTSETLTLTFSSAVDLSKLTIFGRGTDCCQSRDSYVVALDGSTPGIYDIDSSSGVAGSAVFTSAVPEPGEWAMMLSGLAVVGVMARRRRKSKA